MKLPKNDIVPRRRFPVAAFGAIIFCLAALGASGQPAATNLPPPGVTATNLGPFSSPSSADAYKKMSLNELMDLNVTSVSREPEPYSEAPASVQVITSDDIRRSGATVIPEALRLADNLDIAQVTSSSWDISARGFNSSVSDKLLVLMDGRSIYTPLFAGVIWNQQDYLLEDIDRIEVISGPGGTLWGANAVNGVINITSKDAKDTQGLYAEASAGTQLEESGALRYGGMLGSNVYFRVYGKFLQQGAEVFTNNANANDSWNHGQGGFRMDAEGDPNTHFTLQGDFYEGDTDAGAGIMGNTSGGNVLARWSHAFSDESDMSLQMYYDRVKLAAPFPGALTVPSGMLKDDLTTVDIDLQDHFHLIGWNNIVWGLGYRFTHDVDAGAPVVTFLPPVLDQDLYSAFLQDEIRLHDNLFFTIGTKVEDNAYTGFEWQPSGRLQWNIAERQMIWGAISRAVRTPSRYDRDLYQPAPQYAYPFYLVGNSAFESEDVVAYELGYRAQISPRVTGSLTFFYNDYDHLRSLGFAVVPPATLDVFYQNYLQGQTKGVELSGDYQANDWWRLHAGYDGIQERIHVEGGHIDLYGGLNETADPNSQFFFRSSMDLPYHTEFDADVRLIDRVHNNNGSTPGVVPAYGELNMRLAWHATPQLEISIVGQNLLHAYHVEAGFPGPGQEAIERNVYGKATYTW